VELEADDPDSRFYRGEGPARGDQKLKIKGNPPKWQRYAWRTSTKGNQHPTFVSGTPTIVK
jgi:hypothetical protein